MDDVPLKEHLLALMDQRFDAQGKAVDAALSAQKELTTTSFAASEKAITKAEEAQNSYNQTHNDLSRKMDEQYKGMMPRSESLARHASHEARHQELKDDFSKLRLEFKDDLAKMRAELMKEIGSLRESRSEGTGEKGGRLSQQQLTVMVLSAIVAIIGIVSAVVGVAYAIRR